MRRPTRHVRLLGPSLLLAGVLAGRTLVAVAAPPSLSPDNPFATASTLPYGAEPLPRIRDSDYQAALDVGMAQEMSNVIAIAESKAAPTFDNTIAALETTGVLLGRVNQVFQQLVAANTNDRLDTINQIEAPRLQAHSDAILLNARLFDRIRTLYEKRDTLGLNPSQSFLLSWQYRRFIHAGALLPPAKKVALARINERLATLSDDYRRTLLAAASAAAVPVEDRAALDGLSDADIAAAANAAAKRRATKHHDEAPYLLVLRNTTQQPLLERMSNRDLRQRVMAASETRGAHPGPTDLRGLIATVAQLRARKAKLMGYPNYAAYTIDLQMAGTPEAAKRLLLDLVPATARKAAAEAGEIQALIDRQGGGFTLTAADWSFYAAQVRKAKFDVDDAEVRPYFALDRVLQDGVFFAAHQLYGLSFTERHDIPTYDPDMRVFEVFDADGSPLALFMLDPYARPNKSGGAWCNEMNVPSGMEGRKPIIVNSENFSKPADGQPALLSFDDVKTMFHEFGHALHVMFSVQYYPTQRGFNMPTDVIEFPSQFNEHWALDPMVLANYAKHYQTGAPMPQALVDKIKAARNEGQGYATAEYVAAALLDLEWHGLGPSAPRQTDVAAFERAALARYHVDWPAIPPRYHSPYFLHIWANGYESNYYAYLWGEVLDDDAYEWFVEHGGLTRANGQRFRDTMLGLGFTADPMAIYRAFRGRDPSADAIIRERGLE